MAGETLSPVTVGYQLRICVSPHPFAVFDLSLLFVGLLWISFQDLTETMGYVASLEIWRGAMKRRSLWGFEIDMGGRLRLVLVRSEIRNSPG